MKKLVLAASAAIAALGAASAANATVVEGIQVSLGDPSDHFEGKATGTGSGQVDIFNFSIDFAGIASIILGSTASPNFNLDFESVLLDGTSLAITNGFFEDARAAGINLGAGAHTVRVQYKSTQPNVAYSGDIVVTPVSVPAPASWALMTVGLGAMGLIMRRRTQTMRPAYS